MRGPIFTAWINQGLDPATRATINSMGRQADAVGQALAGPVVGGVGRAVSVPWAISLAGLLRLPILFQYLRAIRRGTVGRLPPEVMDQEIGLEGGAALDRPWGDRGDGDGVCVRHRPAPGTLVADPAFDPVHTFRPLRGRRHEVVQVRGQMPVEEGRSVRHAEGERRGASRAGILGERRAEPRLC